MRRPSIILALLGVCGSAVNQAGEMDLSELSIEELAQVRVYAASRFSQTLAEAPSAVTVITAETIRNHGWRTLGEILNSVRGVYITSDRSHSYAGIRGFGRPGDYNFRLLVLVDGIRVNDGLLDDGLLGSELPLSVDLIERVEFVPGPGSAIYGSNAFLGVVSITTRSGQEVGREVALEIGSHGRLSSRVSIGGTSENGNWLISANGLQQDGEDLYFSHYIPYGSVQPTTGGWIQNRDGESLENSLLKVQQGPVTLTLIHGERDKDVPAPIYGSLFGDPRTRFENLNTLADLRFDTHLENWQLTTRLHHGEFLVNSTYPLPGILPNDRLESIWDGGEIHLEGGGMAGHHWALGAEYQRNRYNRYTNAALGLDVTLTKESYGLYLQDELELGEHFHINAGLRYDSYSSFGGIVNPRFGLIYNFDGANTWKLLYGSAYRAPSDLERFFNAGLANLGLNLRPEKIHTWEGLWEHTVGSHQRHIASFFYYQAKDLIELVMVDSKHYAERNLRSAQATGLEYELQLTSDSGWQGRASATWQYAQDSDTGEWLSNSPHFLGKLDVSMPLGPWRLGGELLAMSARRQVTMDSAIPPGRTGSAAVANLVLRGEALAPGLEWRAGIYNLFDTHYADPTFGQTYARKGIPEMPQPERNAALQVVYRWK